MRCRLRNSIVILIVLLALTACQEKSYARMDAPAAVPAMPAPGIMPEPTKAVVHTTDGTVDFAIEVADSEEERARGLMFRNNLDPDYGMLFVFPKEAQVAFWMKNTFIPLDMLFIDADMTIMGIAHATPCEADPCQTYPSGAPAQYVLEINGGLAEEKNIKAGDRVSLISAY